MPWSLQTLHPFAPSRWGAPSYELNLLAIPHPSASLIWSCNWWGPLFSLFHCGMLPTPRQPHDRPAASAFSDPCQRHLCRNAFPNPFSAAIPYCFYRTSLCLAFCRFTCSLFSSVVRMRSRCPVLLLYSSGMTHRGHPMKNVE